MHADETRVSRAVRSVDGRVDSHEDLNSSEAAGQLEMVCGVNERIARCAIQQEHEGRVQTGGTVKLQQLSQELRQHHLVPIAATAPVKAIPVPSVLSETQLDAFWAGIVANLDAARRVASKIVSRQNVDDVVNTGAVRFVESLQGSNPSPFPATDRELRALFLDIVRRYAIDCVRDSKRPPLPIHSHWGAVWEPVISGHNVADRELDSVFARNDLGKYDAPEAEVRRDQDGVNQLRHILERHLDDLSEAQREILVASFFDQEKRPDIAARRGITESTYDNHRRAALAALRDSLAADVEATSGIDRSIWYDRLEELIKRRATRLRGRSSSKKGKDPDPEGKRGNSEGKRGNSKGKRGNSRDERRAVKAERSNSAREPRKNGRKRAAE